MYRSGRRAINPERLVLLTVLSCALLPASQARADRVELEKPVPISTVKADKKPLDGRLVAYDEEGFELIRGRGRTVKVKWSDLAAPGVYNVRSAIIGPKANGEQWIEVGHIMLQVDGGEPFAERAFAKAVKLDPTLQRRADEALLGRPEKKPTAAEAPIDSRGAANSNTEDLPAAGPQMIGKVGTSAWPALTEQRRGTKVAELKTFAEDAAKKLGRELALHETKYFLFYSDLPPQDARNWAGLLDRMYARLAELFGVAREAPAATGRVASRGEYANVWDGKALVLVFQDPDDYRRFQRIVHNTDAGSSAGMCHCFGDGRVHIAFYRQADPLTFAHVLVHESVHGFIHRFRSPAVVPSWANEGLAEVIATELVPRPGRPRERELMARQGLQTRGALGGMLDARHIESWQYPVAETLCSYMIQQDRRRYVDFIVGIKEGLTWEASLEQRYQAPRDRLVAGYRGSLGLKN